MDLLWWIITGISIAVIVPVAGLVSWRYLFAVERGLDPYLSDYVQDIRDLLQDRPWQGLAIIVSMNKQPPKGVEGATVDEKNMEESFKTLNFAILKKTNCNHRQLRALIKAAAEFPYISEAPSCKVIAFYYAGHGGADSNKNPFVMTSDSKQLNVGDIVSPLEPVNARHLKDLSRLFFFDMCQGSRTDDGTRDHTSAQKTLPVLKYAVPAKGNCLVAFAGSIEYAVRGDMEGGGYWTRHLYKNIVEDVDIHIVLAKTWKDTVRFTSDLNKKNKKIPVQGPSMSSCMGPLNLRHIDELEIHRFEYHDAIRHPSPGPFMSRGDSVIEEIDHGLRNIGHLLKKQPKLMHLISWLGCMKNDWQQLGIQLGIPPYELQSIETTRPTQISRLTDVFNKWKEGAYSHYTFQNLLDCLKKMGQNANSPSVKAIYVNLKIHQAEYQNEEDYEEYTY